MAEASYRLPPTIDANDDNISEAFKKWKRQLTVYMTASGTSEKSNKVQSAVMLHCAGPQMIDIYEHFEWKMKMAQSQICQKKTDRILPTC